MSKDITCTVRGERAAFWQEALGTDTVCIISPLPQLADLPGIGESLVYMLDLKTLETDQKERLANVLAARFGLPADLALARMMGDVGVPILADSCTVTVQGAALGLMLPDYDPDETNGSRDWDDNDDPYDYYEDDDNLTDNF